MTRPSSHRLGLREYWHGKLRDMRPVEAEAQRLTRERHPWLYAKENSRAR